MLRARPLRVDGVPDFAREPAQGVGGDVSSADEDVRPAECVTYIGMAAGWGKNDVLKYYLTTLLNKLRLDRIRM